MIQLHYFPSNASMTPHMVLEELGVAYELKLVDRKVNAQQSAEYLRLNPNGKIPVLVDGDLVLYETAAICLHLADTHPHASLAPAVGTPQRAVFYKWLMWLSSTLQPEMEVYFYPDRWANDGAGAAVVKQHAERRIDAFVDQLDVELARHGGTWLLGERYSLLDPYALMLCRWTRAMARPARGLPHVGPYLQRVLARPAIARCFQREGLAQPWV